MLLNTCRCFGRQGPSLHPSSSLMRSMLSPVKEEGTVGYFCQHHRKRPIFRRKETEMNIQSTVPAHLMNFHFLSESLSGDCSLQTTATVHCLLFSALWSFIVRRCAVIAAVCFNLPSLLVSQRSTHELMEQTSQKVCMTALSKPATLFPWCPLRRLFATGEHRAQSCPDAL